MQADLIEAGGARLHVRRWGSPGAPPILYWHGGGGGSDEWPRIAPALVEAGYAVYAPEAPGYGESPPLPADDYLASNVAAIATALVDELGIGPAIWVGFSWGASIGIHAVARSPDRFRALVLLDGGYLAPEDDPDYDPSLDFSGRIESWKAQLEQQEEEDDGPIEVVAAAMAGSNVEPALPLLPRLAGMPVLLVAATEPPEWKEIRDRRIEHFRSVLPHADVVRVQTGHGVLQDAGDEVRHAVVAWLERLPPTLS